MTFDARDFEGGLHPLREVEFRAWARALAREYEQDGSVALSCATALLQGDVPLLVSDRTPPKVDLRALESELEAFPSLRLQAIQEAFRELWYYALDAKPTKEPEYPYLTDDDIDEAWHEEGEDDL